MSAGLESRNCSRPQLDLNPDQRATFLERECDGDQALRAEIESLLKSDEQTGAFIEQPAFRIPRDLFPETRGRTDSLVGSSAPIN